MKKLFISSLFALLAVSIIAKIRHIDTPYYDKGELQLSVSGIDLSDTDTRLHVDIYSRPNYWARVSSETYLEGTVTGKQYKLKGVDGVAVNEKYVLGDSGYVSTVMVFEPIEPSDTIIDLVEPDGWTVKGLRLTDVPGIVTTHIGGSCIGHPDISWLLACESGADERVNKTYIIPVRNGVISYDLKTDGKHFYNVTPGIQYLNGSWRSATFFAGNDSVNIAFPENLYDDDIPVTGGPNTNSYAETFKKYSEYFDKYYYSTPQYKRLNEMWDTGEIYSPEYREIMAKKAELPNDSINAAIRKLGQNDKIYSSEGKRLRAAGDSLANVAKSHFYSEVLTSPTIGNLLMIYKLNKQNQVEEVLEIFKNHYADVFTDTPYHQALSSLLKDDAPEPGKKFIDFCAPDLDGNIVKASDIIRGKVAVIDLWASWCGPCRQHSIDIIPLYNKYKDRGFTVLGVARENDSDKAMRTAIERDGYPWLNLIELNDANRIWEKYRAGNSGGRIVLVNKDGTILAVDPSAEQISKLLSILLK